MDPYNLGICFGPTLLPIPPDRDQVAVYYYEMFREHQTSDCLYEDGQCLKCNFVTQRHILGS